jgi:protein-S-isoprenylcysteine O-methyltransferase Ste14
MEWLTEERANTAIQTVWFGLALLWIWKWRSVKTTTRRETVGSGLSYTAILLAGLGLMCAPSGWRLLPYSPEVGFTAVAFNWIGVLFAVWARLHLGTNWSATATVKKDHELIRTGPYGLVRHPIYCGMLLGSLGVALETGRWPAPIGLAVVFLGFRMKSRAEERLMEEQFGAQYEEYRSNTPGLIPFVV